MAIETVAAWLVANPEVIPAVTSIGSSIYESLFPDEAKQIQLEVLEDQKNFRRMLSRQSRWYLYRFGTPSNCAGC